MIKNTFLLAIFSSFLFSCNNNDDYVDLPDLNERLYAGGETTVFSENSTAFRTPAVNIYGTDLDMHLLGDTDFEQAFVTAPAQINNGLGSIFNNTSCVSCHPKDGRAAFPENMVNLSGLLLRASIPGMDAHGGPNPVPGFGTQIQNQAVFGTFPEARYQVAFETKTETLADGTVVTLRKPVISLYDSYIPFPANGMLSPRIATPVFGLGLLESIPEANLLAIQDVNDTDGDGISGKANYVWDPTANQLKIGRFGWKAGAPTVLVQCAGAYVDDMGVTNYVFPNEVGASQSNGQDGLTDDPEIADETLNQVTFYCRTLAVPAPRNITTDAVRKGAKTFEEISCTKCHVPKQQTGFNIIAAISNQTIYPYTDLLLHDMGADLADNRPDFLASGTEWKTRPLWGIGLTQVVNGHTHFLHDGRARNMTEAILWHGGEAQASKEKFKQLSTQKRNELLAFLNSL
ncbi:thiol oxidoreductase [Flavobacterium sp. WG47]|nr:di-heme oxidoredictase family protein [Flavobacterium sp. WG47]MCF6132015.1 thiol oxidoreductase [Flavobacterium sp. WG47]